MRIKGNDYRLATHGPGAVLDLLEQGLVAQMNTVEIADSNDWMVKGLRDKIEIMIDDHGFPGITGLARTSLDTFFF